MAHGVDLHIHSDHSDGLASTAEIARQALSAGLSCIALADHNGVDGLEELHELLDGAGVRVVDAVEMSADGENESEIHILGYGIDPHNELLRAAFARVVELKRQQLDAMVSLLRRRGIDISPEEVPDRQGAYVGRPALARLLVQKGVVHTAGQAFARYLGVQGDVYVPLGAIGPAECVELIHRAGGLAVLGHPSIGLLDAWAARLAEAGLDGIEVYRPNIQGSEELYAQAVARDFGFVETGGSDWHGRPEGGPLGTFVVQQSDLRPFFARLGDRGGPGADIRNQRRSH